MQSILKYSFLILIGCSMIACSLGGIIQSDEAPPAPPPASKTIPAAEPSPGLTSPPADQPAAILDPCSIITTADAEAILMEPAGPPQSMNGSCIFTNVKDSFFMVSAAAAQEQDSAGILEGQTMMTGFAGGSLDEARMARIKSLAQDLDIRGVFSELVAASEGLPTLKARLVDDDDFDLVYWVWISAQTRRQAAFVAARGKTLVNINLIVADTQSEESMLAASKSLAENIFERLPVKFILPQPAPTPTLPPPTAAPSPVGEVILPQANPTAVPTAIPQSGPSPVPTWVGPTPVPPSGPTPVPQSGPTLIPSPTFVN